MAGNLFGGDNAASAMQPAGVARLSATEDTMKRCAT
jgi:hypothetical protein